MSTAGCRAGKIEANGHKPRYGVITRLESRWNGRLSGDQFCVYVANRLVIPDLRPDQLEMFSHGDLTLDALTQAYIRTHFEFLFASTCLELGISQKFSRAYRPQTNGKAERFIQSALREWAYRQPYASSDQRRDALPVWTHFYNWHRPHHGINLAPPVSRLSVPRKNLLTLHS